MDFMFFSSSFIYITLLIANDDNSNWDLTVKYPSQEILKGFQVTLVLCLRFFFVFFDFLQNIQIYLYKALAPNKNRQKIKMNNFF